ncbi:Upstream stimulatory factor [Atta colombica]|uniref:Upstream stimulatory factor n=1 Tax=Atta colombica TaxID=520822 RepID=A0A195BBT5_9HYME|nr:Upstream stimulatory factor [Atta colombica]
METNHFDTIDESANENVIGAETVDVVLEEAEIVDCDADEQQDDDIQYHLYAINRRNNTVAYKVMQVSNDNREDNEISIATPVNNTVQVLTAPLNGQLYVLSNSNDIVTTESTKAVVPSVAKLHIEGTQNIITTVKKRDERRRVTHNEVERRRRDKISSWISKLAKLLADCEQYMDEEDTKPNLETLTRCAGDFVFRQQPMITTRTMATATTCYQLGGTRRTASSIAAPCPEIICAIIRTAMSLNTRIITDWATGVLIISRSRNRWKECVSNDVLNMPGRAHLRTSLFVLSHCFN